MILIYGSRGFMGSAIAAECSRLKLSWVAGELPGMGGGGVANVTTQIRAAQAELVINAAAYIPNPTVDACKDQPDWTLVGNVLLPNTLAVACEQSSVPLMHLSTGCLFNEEREYTENDTPTRGWPGYCGFYVGTKLLAERVVREYHSSYILRLRLPFDEFDHPRNYLSKLAAFDKVYDHINSLTHRGDFAKWALDLWLNKAQFGTYHCVNSGQISAESVVNNMHALGLIKTVPPVVNAPGTTGARLSNDKLAKAIGPIRSVYDAVADSLTKWKKSE